ncbi:alpha/beta hydrolase [Sphingobacteriales bacterium UPWRP_1]|nr:hypothetical protein B6N25_16270 [Sphingobacteriales bacterium TSM_CSS]PSJ73971.1 alpha/beta hydrolase [Sphingobacteriales bacterium UPWRP_1]
MINRNKMKLNKKIYLHFLSGLALLSILAAAAVIFQERILLFPIPLHQNHTYRFKHGQPFEELFFTKADSVSLNALYFTTPKPKGLIFYLHGNAANVQRYGRYAPDFTQKGYNLLMYDYRGFGKSRGIINETTFYTDAQMLYDSIQQCLGFKQEDIIIYGRSLGTGIATKLAADNHPRALMLETPYYNIADVAQRRVPLLPYNELLRYHFRTDIWIKAVKCPVFIFHGTNDWVVPYQSGQLLLPFIGNPAHFVTIPGGRHNNLRTFTQYHQALQNFLQESAAPPLPMPGNG